MSCISIREERKPIVRNTRLVLKLASIPTIKPEISGDLVGFKFSKYAIYIGNIMNAHGEKNVSNPAAKEIIIYVKFNYSPLE